MICEVAIIIVGGVRNIKTINKHELLNQKHTSHVIKSRYNNWGKNVYQIERGRKGGNIITLFPPIITNSEGLFRFLKKINSVHSKVDLGSGLSI